MCYVHETQPRAELLRLALAMKKGKTLAEHRSVTALRVREFKLAPHDGLGDVPYIVDGEAMASGATHVRVLPRKLKVFGPANQGMASAHNTSAVSLNRIEVHDTATFSRSDVSRVPIPPTLLTAQVVTQEEVRQLMRHASMLKRRRQRKEDARQRRQDACAAELLAGISEAVEFVEDEFTDEALPEIDTYAGPVVGAIMRERTRIIQAVSVLLSSRQLLFLIL